MGLSDDGSKMNKAEAARDAFRSVCVQKSQADFERILSNASYEICRKEVDAVFDGKMAEIVASKTTALINNLSSYSVFVKPNAWDREASKAWAHLQTAMDEAKPLIADRVNAVINEMTDDQMHDLISIRIADAVLERIAKVSP